MSNENYTFRVCPYCGMEVCNHLEDSFPLGSEKNELGCSLLRKHVIAIIESEEDGKD